MQWRLVLESDDHQRRVTLGGFIPFVSVVFRLSFIIVFTLIVFSFTLVGVRYAGVYGRHVLWAWVETRIFREDFPDGDVDFWTDASRWSAFPPGTPVTISSTGALCVHP